ncbi:MAG: shikimate dehydrogenase [Candidatus Atribacteria bacterium]|nr:shikimate dehydrogenase [Candidatus Atribacteria bacterium]
MIDAQTRLLALLGHPVSHSLSPSFQNAALQFLGLPFVYLAFDVLPQNLSKAVEAIKTLNARGFNVTVPHKERICSFLDHLEEEAQIVQAVNTVVNEDGRLLGYNTDIYGFEKSMEEEGVRIEGKNVLLLGAGGVSRAIVFALGRKNITSLIIANRTLERAQELALFAERFFSFPVKVASWEDAMEGEGECFHGVDVIVNATSLGIKGEAIPLDWHKFLSCSLVMDVVYRKGSETGFVVEARKRGIHGFSGKSMLLYQGVRSFELFTGHPAPVEIMKKFLEEG